MDHFVADVLVHEMIDTDNRIIPDTLLGRYINPGHTVEDMWFIIHQALGRTDRDTIERAAAIVLRTLGIGWDTEMGGYSSLWIRMEGCLGAAQPTRKIT